MCSPFTSAYARTGPGAGAPCAQANSAANGMMRAVLVTDESYQKPGLAGRCSAQRLFDQRGNAGDVLLQAIRQAEPLGDEGALVVANPDAPPWVLPHEHTQRELEADQRPRDHQWGPGARVAEDEQLLLLHHEPDVARAPAVVDANEDGEAFAARGLLDPPHRLGDGIRAQPARNALRRWLCRHAQSSYEHASERVAESLPDRGLRGGMPQARRGFPSDPGCFQRTCRCFRGARRSGREAAQNLPTKFTFKPPGTAAMTGVATLLPSSREPRRCSRGKRTPQPAPMAMPPRSSEAQCFSAIMRRNPVDTVSTPAAPQSHGAAGDSSRVAVIAVDTPRAAATVLCPDGKLRWESGSLKS